MNQLVPVITIDGPSGTGKGTIASRLSQQLHYHLLDSGALYRSLAWLVLEAQLDPTNQEALTRLLNQVELELKPLSPPEPPEIFCNGQKINAFLRDEAVGTMASQVASIPVVRSHLTKYQRLMRCQPGLIADGRDMGSVIFPDASAKFYLMASPEVRAERRYKQLKQKGINASLRQIREDLDARDYRDEHRDISPMVATPDMIRIDTSDLTIEQVFDRVMAELRKQLPNVN